MKIVVPALATLLLAAPVAVAAEGHSHGHAPAGLSELKLDHGRKWQTDAALRQGMAEIRAALDAVHVGRLGYDGLAKAVEGQIEFMVANCKLPPEADQQLHLVLGEVMEGADKIARPDARDSGARQLLAALNAYGQHFDHPGWEPVGH
jgi:hypothetical protein